MYNISLTNCFVFIFELRDFFLYVYWNRVLRDQVKKKRDQIKTNFYEKEEHKVPKNQISNRIPWHFQAPTHFELVYVLKHFVIK